MSFSAVLSSAALLPLLASSVMAQAGVVATFPNGETNPPAPFLAEAGATVNQTSMARLLTLNSVDDFCLFGPPEAGPDSLIGNVEPIVVAYCTKPRNNARLIPDGTIQSAHFIKTPLYVQIQGFLDGTKINIPYGDDGGELDPHGAENLGNPIGGNVTSNVSGQDVFYEEWMSFMSYNQFCLRICTAQTNDVSAALQCEHELDVMGCQFVMPGDYSNNSFTSCDGEPAAPPGLYPQPDGSTSTFRQRYEGTYTADGVAIGYTVGQTVTPAGPAFTPSTSNCQSVSTISNGVATNGLVPTGGAQASSGRASGSSSSGPVATASASASNSGSASARSSSARSSGAATGAAAAASNSAASAAAAASSAVSGATKMVGSGAGAYGFFASVVLMVGGGVALLI